MRACSQIAECSLSYAKVRQIREIRVTLLLFFLSRMLHFSCNILQRSLSAKCYNAVLREMAAPNWLSYSSIVWCCSPHSADARMVVLPWVFPCVWQGMKLAFVGMTHFGTSNALSCNMRIVTSVIKNIHFSAILILIFASLMTGGGQPYRMGKAHRRGHDKQNTIIQIF